MHKQFAVHRILSKIYREPLSGQWNINTFPPPPRPSKWKTSDLGWPKFVPESPPPPKKLKTSDLSNIDTPNVVYIFWVSISKIQM